jgi:hypothetical protein
MTRPLPICRDDSRLRWAGFTIYRHPNSGVRVWIIGPRGTRFFVEQQAHIAIDRIIADGFRHISPGRWHAEWDETTYTTEAALDHIERIDGELRRYERISE